MNAELLAKALGGHRAGTSWIARCPAHDDRVPSLSISAGHAGKILVRCHAGCDQQDVIVALMNRGLWNARSRHGGSHLATRASETVIEPVANERKRTEAALKVWHSSQTIVGSLAEIYLKSRGIILAEPPSLRFHPGLKHAAGNTWPAMVALVTHGKTGLPMAIHRTFLTRNGQGKAPVAQTKMMLGPCRGGAVRFSECTNVIMVGEGIETCLAVMQATGKPVWAALSTSGLRSLILPSSVLEVMVLADGDAPGEAAAQNCAQRWLNEGRRIRIARAPLGMDFNDLLMNRNPVSMAVTDEH